MILTIEKKSNDTSIKSITGKGVLDVNIDTKNRAIDLYVDEDELSTELTILLNNVKGKLKLGTETEEQYELEKIVRTINLNTNDMITFEIDVLAEDETFVKYTVTVFKQANLKLLSVEVNNINLPYETENERYSTVVANRNRPEIVIKTENPKQKIKLLDEAGNVLATGTGTLQVTQTLSSTTLQNNYKIKVTSNKGDDTWDKLFGNLNKTLGDTESLFEEYYELARFIHLLSCTFEHHDQEFGSTSCEGFEYIYK